MSIWIGHDGSLNDDDGDGPAMTSYGQEFVGQDDLLSSALSSMGSGGGGGSSGGLSGSLGSGGSGNLGSMFGGDSSGEGGGLADLFGKAAQVAIPMLTKAATQAATSHDSSPPQAAPPSTPSQAAPSHAQAHPAARRAHARASIDPKARLNLMLSHLAKKYKLAAPASSGSGDSGSLGEVGDFVSKMMGGPKAADASHVASGTYVGDLGDLFGDVAEDVLSTSLHHGFHPRHPAHVQFHRGHERDGMRGVPTGMPYDQWWETFGRLAGIPYKPESSARSRQQAQQYSPLSQQSQQANPVTYSPYSMPSNQKMVQLSSSTPRTPAAKLGKFVNKMMGASAYGDSTSESVTPAGKASSGPVSESLRHTQKLLNAFWHKKVLVEDGIMGPNTIYFIKEFQRQSHLPVTGQDDAATRATLSPALADSSGGRGSDGRGLSGTVPGGASYLSPGSGGGDASRDADWSSGLKKAAQFWLQPPPLTIEQQLASEQKKTSSTSTQGFYPYFPGLWESDEMAWWMT